MESRSEKNETADKKQPEKDTQPTSACEILRFMLMNPPEPRTQTIGGGISVGYTHQGNAIWTPQSSSVISSFDEHMMKLMRAKFACEEDMVVSPVRGYTTRELYSQQLAESRKQAEERENMKKIREAEKTANPDKPGCIVM